MGQMKKLGIVALNWNNLGGSHTWAITCYDMFKRCFPEWQVRIYTVNGSGKRGKNDNYIPDMIYLNCSRNGAKYENELNDNDLIYFTTPGFGYGSDKVDSPGWEIVLEHLSAPFIVGFLSCWEKKIYAKYYKFLNHKMLKGIQFTSKYAREAYKDDKTIYDKDWFVGDWVDISDASLNSVVNKRSLIIATSRVIATKGTQHLVDKIYQLSQNGIDIHIHGAISFYSFRKDLENKIGKELFDFIYQGEYSPRDIKTIMDPAMFLFEYVSTKNIESGKHYQLNYTIVEGMKYGVIPILSKHSVPEDIKDGINALLIDKDDDWVLRLKDYSIESKMRLKVAEANMEYIKDRFSDDVAFVNFKKFIKRNGLMK